MGCDIHMYAEVKIRSEWRTVGRIFEYDYYDAKAPTTIEWYNYEGEWESNQILTIHPYDSRNYRLFAILADVRNSDCIKPISDPRNIPDDVSDFVKHQSNEYGIDGHSHSWLSLTELESYPWDGLITSYGVVDQSQYKEFKRTGRPDGWCGGVMGKYVVMVDNEDMDRIIANNINDDYSYYTNIEWQWPASDATRDFSSVTLPALRLLLDKQGIEDVRIVFWFDN